MRVFKYKRKSSDEEDRQMLSFKNQEREIQTIPGYSTFTIVGDKEESKSAKAPNTPKKIIREDFEGMCEAIEAGKVDAIGSWKTHRIARNPVDGGRIIWYVQKGLKIVTPKKTYDVNDIGILYDEFRDNHKFINELRENTQAGTMTKLAQGKAPIRAPIGYRNTPEKKQGTREILPDEKNWDLTRKAWDLLLSGKYRIAKINKIAVEEWGLTHWNGKPISRSQMYRMFTTTFYYGEYFYKGEMRWGTHKQMITQDEYDLAQRILGSRGRPRFINREFAYSEWMKWICGSSITAHDRFRRWCYTCKKKFNAETFELCPQCKNEFSDNLIHLVSYHCSRKKNPKCKQPSISLTNLEKQIDNILGTFEIPEDYSKWALEMLRKESENEITDRQNIEKSQTRKIVEISKRLDNLTYKFLSPENEKGEMISEEDFKKMKIK